MSDATNPFGDLEDEMRQQVEAVDRQLEAVEAIDQMPRDVNAFEADFLDSALRRLRARIPLTDPQIEVLIRMCDQYGIDFEK